MTTMNKFSRHPSRETESNLVEMILHMDVFLGQSNLVPLQQIKNIAIQKKIEKIKNQTLKNVVNSSY